MNETAVLRAAARVGLVDHATAPIDLTGDDVDRIVTLARVDRLSGLLSAAIETGTTRAWVGVMSGPGR